MNINKIKLELQRQLQDSIYNCFSIHYSDFGVQRNHKEGYGDFSSTVAFSLNKLLKKPPMEIANNIESESNNNKQNKYRLEAVAPGFLNLYLPKDWKFNVIKEIQNRTGNNNLINHVLLESDGQYVSFKKEVLYIAHRTQWVLEVFQKEGVGLYPIRVEDIKLPIEEILINQMIYWDELTGDKELDKEKLKQCYLDIIESFWKYHNSVVLRNLEETQRNLLLNIFLAIKNIMMY